MCECNPEVGRKCAAHDHWHDRLLALIDQKAYVVTPSTGVVHSLPCIRSTALNPLPWPEFRDKDDDRACSHCLPNGLPIEGAA